MEEARIAFVSSMRSSLLQMKPAVPMPLARHITGMSSYYYTTKADLTFPSSTSLRSTVDEDFYRAEEDRERSMKKMNKRKAEKREIVHKAPETVNGRWEEGMPEGYIPRRKSQMSRRGARLRFSFQDARIIYSYEKSLLATSGLEEDEYKFRWEYRAIQDQHNLKREVT